jgi:hypothetical protein
MGKYGRDEGGNPYVHVKAWKQGKLIVEVVQTEGVLSLRCRKCLRWQRITIRGRVQIKIEHLDAMLALFRE